jgi:hypothetical protein
MINKLVVVFLLSFFSTLSLAADVEKPKTKQVCKDVVTNGKTTKQCKTIKVHKKLEGTQVPSEKKK